MDKALKFIGLVIYIIIAKVLIEKSKPYASDIVPTIIIIIFGYIFVKLINPTKVVFKDPMLPLGCSFMGRWCFASILGITIGAVAEKGMREIITLLANQESNTEFSIPAEKAVSIFNNFIVPAGILYNGPEKLDRKNRKKSPIIAR